MLSTLGKIWNNVIILAKAGKSSEKDCHGALSAAKALSQNANPKILAYEFCPEQIKKEVSEDIR